VLSDSGVSLPSDMSNRPFLDRKNGLARLLRNSEAGILFNEHIAENGPVVFAHACRLGAEGIVSNKVDGAYQSGQCRVSRYVISGGRFPSSEREPRDEAHSGHAAGVTI
jgi:hypothetical protein